MSLQSTNAGLEAAIVSLREKLRLKRMEREIWEFLARSDKINVSNRAKKKIVNSVIDFSEKHYENLKPLSKIYTAISWRFGLVGALYTLIEDFTKIDPVLGSLLKEKGITYYIICKGEPYAYVESYYSEEDISCDTSNWDDHIPMFRYWSKAHKNLVDQVYVALETFGESVVQQVELLLTKEMF